jgi:energy-coupling factor transporter ATP-binding protein EcfA2
MAVDKVLIDVQNLSFSYDNSHPVIKDANFSISAGEIVAITGLSGSGKTTLGYILKGLIPHSIKGQLQGAVHVAGFDVFHTKPAILARYVGMVFQDLNAQLFSATVLEEIRFGLRNLKLDLAMADEALINLQIEDLQDQIPMNLSAGQKQRVVLASVIASRPKVLILDEPSAHLDAPSKRRLLHWLQQLNKESGITILLIDQDPWLAGELCQSVLLLDDKHIFRVPKDRVLSRSQNWSWIF